MCKSKIGVTAILAVFFLSGCGSEEPPPPTAQMAEQNGAVPPPPQVAVENYQDGQGVDSQAYPQWQINEPSLYPATNDSGFGWTEFGMGALSGYGISRMMTPGYAQPSGSQFYSSPWDDARRPYQSYRYSEQGGSRTAPRYNAFQQLPRGATSGGDRYRYGSQAPATVQPLTGSGAGLVSKPMPPKRIGRGIGQDTPEAKAHYGMPLSTTQKEREVSKPVLKPVPPTGDSGNVVVKPRTSTTPKSVDRAPVSKPAFSGYSAPKSSGGYTRPQPMSKRSSKR